MRNFICLMLVLIFAGFANADLARRHYWIEVVDEFGEPVTDLTSITFYATGTSTAATIYDAASGSTEVGSSGVVSSGISDGIIEFWYAEANIKYTLTDGTYSRTMDTQTTAMTRVAFPTYLTAMSGYDLSDSDDLAMGTDDDWTIDCDTATRLDFIPAADGSIYAIGDGTYQADVYMYSGGTTKYWLFDEGAEEVYLAHINQQFDDDATLNFGSDDDFTVYSDTANTLEFDPASAGNNIKLGTSATDAVDITWYGDTSGDTVVFDEENCEILLTDIDIQYDDDADAIFGTGNDFVIESDTAKTLEILPGAASDDYTVNLGVDQSGVDLKIFGATTGEYWLYDASADSVLANTGNYSYTATDAEANQFKVDATGTVAGYGIVFETTDGGVQINADGASNGDIAIDAADDMTLTAAGDLTLAVTGTFKGGGAIMDNFMSTPEVVTGTTDTLTASQSGQMIIYTQTGGACTVTLPEATSSTVGVYFWLIDGNASAGNDLAVDPEGDGTINGDTAGHKITCENDRDGEGILIVCTAADTWYTMACGSSTVWTEE